MKRFTWLKIKKKLLVNPTKSQHTTFTLRRATCPPVFLNQTPLPEADVVRYLGLNLDKRLICNPHTRLKERTLIDVTNF
jgi:hypothetical protein